MFMLKSECTQLFIIYISLSLQDTYRLDLGLALTATRTLLASILTRNASLPASRYTSCEATPEGNDD